MGSTPTRINAASSIPTLPGLVRCFVGGTEFPKVPVGPKRPQNCNIRHNQILQHGYDACATKYGRLTRQVPSETMFFVQNLEPSTLLLDSPTAFCRSSIS